MKRIPLVIALVASLALAVGPVSAAPSSHGAGSTAVASGWRIAPDGDPYEGNPRVQFTVAAQFAPGKASGTYQYANVLGGALTGSITCGNVDAGVAVIGGHITDGNIVVGGDFFVFLVDNGTPLFGSTGPDQVGFTSVRADGGEFVSGDGLGADFPEDFPSHCPQARGETFGNQALPTVLGDIVVH